MRIGEIIEKYCTEHRMSKRQFAIKSHVSSGYISMLINGINPKTGKPMRPTVETYNNIAYAMGMSLDELFNLMDDAPVVLKPNAEPKGTGLFIGKTEESYFGLADAIAERLKAKDAIWAKREALRRDPKRRLLFDLAEHGSERDVDAAVALLDALKATNPDFYDGDEPS